MILTRKEKSVVKYQTLVQAAGGAVQATGCSMQATGG